MDILTGKLKQYRQLLDRKTELSAQLEEVKQAVEVLNMQLREEFERLGIQNLTVPDVGKFVLRSETHPSIENQETLVDWLKKKGDYDILLSFNTNKFKTYYKELLKNNEELPHGVSQFVKTDVVVRKA